VDRNSSEPNSSDKQVIVLFDGLCNLCSSTVNWVINHDPAGRVRFASLQSERGQHLLRAYGLPATLDSFVMISRGTALVESDAALALGIALGGPLSMLSKLGRCIPRLVRDQLYRFIAEHRYQWFGRRDQCMVPTADLRARFLADA
jgi:predicted DCC family thiol-disulfide oxidoreductase YuxK